MSNDNFLLGLMLKSFFKKKQNSQNQNNRGCLSSIVGWIFIILVISIISSLRKPIGTIIIKMKHSFGVHPVISWAIVAVLLLLIIICCRKIQKHKKVKLMRKESENISQKEKSDSIEE